MLSKQIFKTFSLYCCLMSTIFLNISAIPAQVETLQPLSNAQSLMSAGRYDEAMQIFDQVLVSDKDNVEALLSKAKLFYYQQKHVDALNVLDVLTQLSADNKEAWYLKGLILFEMREFDNSVINLDKALVIDPEFLLAKSTKCSIYTETGKSEQSKQCIQQLK